MNKQPVALVTGGSRGIGRGICLELAKEGYNVLINYFGNVSAAEQTHEMIEKAGGQAESCQADIAQTEDRDLLLEYCMENFGRLDLLVNNADIAPPEQLDVLETTTDNYESVLDVNLKGPFFLTQAAARLMIRLLEGKDIPSATIIIVSSINAYTASISRGTYCISEAGLSMVVPLFASRLAEFGINVYEIRPGLIETDMPQKLHKQYDHLIKEGFSPIKRWGQPQEVGKAVAMLARGDLPFSTGEVINVDGGFHLKKL
ncbi:MAG: 3-ketoacyl-ACP reductase [Planctomycetota bacterium]|jgi:NAD(P)-dependent dehydrogenase (short-subunit alcohol dehydrogenase family)